ncbi:Subtilisin-like protease 2 [Cytospora mali]|uniref:Subtilisin-like protease 2 n=1 Tax=Cytospora mali TaxID=578113 RepID=A0A194VI44_CYTMA|nr:Subtilisin-like protease 2 [Valsa mali]
MPTTEMPTRSSATSSQVSTSSSMDFSETESPTTTSTIPASSGLSTSSAPTATHTPFTGFSLPDVLITIDNNTIYQLLLGQQSINTILSDGTIAKITDQAIELGSTSISIPSSMDLMLEGGRKTQQLGPWIVEFSMRQFQKCTSSCLSGKFTCFKKAAQSFVDSAGTLAASLGKVGASMLQDGFCDAWDAAGLATEASPYATTTESMSEGIGSLVNSLEGSVEGLDGAMSMVNGDLSSFEEYEMEGFGNIKDNVFPAYPNLRPTISSLKNLNKILQLAIKHPTGTLLTIAKNQYVQLTTGLGLVSVATFTLDKVSSADLDATDTQSTESATPQDTRMHYIKFSEKFPLLLLHVLTKTLDNDAGVKTAAKPSVVQLGPGYTTELSVGLGKVLKYLPFIILVYVHPTFEEMQNPLRREYLSWQDNAGLPRIIDLPKSSSSHSKRFYLEGLGYWHQEAMSRQKNVAPSLQRYRREEPPGQGITIFVIDSGFNLGSTFNGAELHNPDTYVVPNRLSLLNIPENIQAPEDLTDYSDHGTGMAAAAAGTRYGIASMAHLYLIKFKNAQLSNGQWVVQTTTPEALVDAFSQVVDIVKDRGLQGKAVVSFSNSYVKYNEVLATKQRLDDAMKQEYMETSSTYDTCLDKFLAEAKENGIIFVNSAGNNGNCQNSKKMGLGDQSPQDRGTSDNEIITVGAVYQDGTIWEGGTPRGVHVGRKFVQDPNNPLLSNNPGAKLGWVDIYAPGVQVEVPSSYDGDRLLATGTSVATALVAGLTAYFLALSENSDRFTWSVDKNNAIPWGVRMKQYMTALSYQWNDAPGGGVRPDMPSLGFNFPSEVNVAYNGAYGPMNTCPMPPPTKRDNIDDVDQYDATVDSALCLPPADTTEVTWTTWDAETAVSTSYSSSETLLTSQPSSSFWTSTLSAMTAMPSFTEMTPTTTVSVSTITSVSNSSTTTTAMPSSTKTMPTTTVSLSTESSLSTSSSITTITVQVTSSRTVTAESTHPVTWPGHGEWELKIYNSSDCTGEHNNLSLMGLTFDYEGWGQDCHNVNYTDLDPTFTSLMSWRIYNGNCTFYDGGEVRVHSIRDELTPRDLRILLLRPLDERVLAGLVEEGDRIPLPVVITRLARRLDPVERRLEAVVRPAHEHVADVADDSAGLVPDLRPGVAQRKLGHRLAAGADLQPGLSFTLEQQRQQAPVSMGASSVSDRAVVGLRRRKVAKQAEDILALRVRRVVRLEEIIVREAEAPGEADHQLVGDALDAVHKVQAVVLEARQEGVVHPHILVAVVALAAREHVLAELELVGLLHVGRAGGGPELGIPLPADVLGVPGHCGLDVVREGEEGLGGGEGLVYLGLGDAMVDDGEEPDFLGGVT